MASESVTSIRADSRHCLPIDDIDRGLNLVMRARAIVDLMGCASTSNNPPCDESLANASMAVDDMLEELSGIVTRQRSEV